MMSKPGIATILAIALFAFSSLSATAQVNHSKAGDISLDESQASRFARLALKCVSKEYPNKPIYVINSATDVEAPKELAPGFLRLLRLAFVGPRALDAGEINTHIPQGSRSPGDLRNALGVNLPVETNILAEVADPKQPNRQSFERTYGWAWLLKLAEELQLWEDADARLWSENLRPLVEALATSYIALPSQANLPDSHGRPSKHRIRVGICTRLRQVCRFPQGT